MEELPDRQDLRSVYAEICKSYHGIDDFRARLLALLPVASGAGGLLILAEKDAVRDYFGPIGLFGAVVTLGLFVYELRGIQKCTALIKAGAVVETRMKVKGPFRSNPKGYLYGLIGARTAGWIVYLAVFAAWSYMAFAGFKN